MVSEFLRMLSIFVGVLCFIGFTTFYSIDKDTRGVIRRSIRYLEANRFIRYEHLVYLIAKLGQNRIHLLVATISLYILHIIIK